LKNSKESSVGQSHHVLPGLSGLPRTCERENTGHAEILIKPVLAPLGEIAPKHIILVDIDEYMEVCEQNYAKAGNTRAVTKLKNPPREDDDSCSDLQRSTGCEFSRSHAPDVGHRFLCSGTPILPIYNQAAVFAPETPIFPSPRLIYTIQDGKEICATLGDRMAMLLKGHALLCAGIAWNMLRFTRFIWSGRLTCSS